MKIGLAIMRMQPLHIGHQKIIDMMLQDNDLSYIVIGSIDKHDEHNPYSFEDRAKMIQSIYSDKIDNNQLKIIGLKDINNPPKWVDYVLSALECRPNVYYCGQGQDGNLFEAKGIKVQQLMRKAEDVSGTKIRQKIRNQDITWQEDVPQQIYKIIEQNNI